MKTDTVDSSSVASPDGVATYLTRKYCGEEIANILVSRHASIIAQCTSNGMSNKLAGEEIAEEEGMLRKMRSYYFF